VQAWQPAKRQVNPAAGVQSSVVWHPNGGRQARQQQAKIRKEREQKAGSRRSAGGVQAEWRTASRKQKNGRQAVQLQNGVGTQRVAAVIGNNRERAGRCMV